MLATWSPYFIAMSASAAAVFALLFVAFQVNDEWRKKDQALERHWATGTLYELAVPAVISLTVLMPHVLVWLSITLTLSVVGLVLTFQGRHLYRRILRTESDNLPTTHEWNGKWGTRIHTGIYGLLLLGSGTALWNQIFSTDPGRSGWFVAGIWIVAGVSLWLLISGAFQSWRQLAQHDPSNVPLNFDTDLSEAVEVSGTSVSTSRSM